MVIDNMKGQNPKDILIELITYNENSVVLNTKKNYRINTYNDEASVYILLSGKIAVLNRYDDLCHYEFHDTSIIGISQLYKKNKIHYIRCLTDCTFIIIPASVLKDVLTQNKLWDVAFNVLAENLERILDRSIVTEKRSYELVVKCLENIWEADINSSIYSYIMKRCSISRSSIYKTVNDLIKQKIIVVSRGRLINMDIDKLKEVKKS